MNTLVSNTSAEITSGLVEVLTLPRFDVPLGYKLSGVRPGPTALISAQSGIVDAIFDKLARLPTLPWLRGSIYLMSQDILLHASRRDLEGVIPDLGCDEAIVLPFAPQGDPAQILCAAEQGYWTTLRLCTRLGIIEGRGVNLYDGPQVRTRSGVFGSLA